MTLQLHEVFALVCAVVLGGAIGFEREINDKPAGLRTNILICLGAATIIIIAKHLALPNSDGITRIAAGIVTGVGFLGAGALIRQGSGIQGLTTAASIWLVAAIGIACGAGLYLIAVAVTLLALIVLLGLSPLTKKIHKKFRKSKDS